MTCKEFKKKHIYGLRNLGNKAYTNEIEYTPERSLFDFKLPNKFPVLKVYDKREDSTYLFIYCAGVIAISPFSDSKEGYSMKFKGNDENILDKLLESEKFTNFLRSEYARHEEKMRQYREDNKEDDCIEIPTGPRINTAVSPEEVKDVAALYDVY